MMLDLLARLLVSASLLGGAATLPLLPQAASVAPLDAGVIAHAVPACPAAPALACVG